MIYAIIFYAAAPNLAPQRSFMEREKDNKKLLIYALILLFSLVLFSGAYGIGMLNPTNADYVYSTWDTEQHYFGWVAYRNSDWHFPLGLHDGLTYPDLTSVIFTDSIPLFAIPGKLLSPLLPETFQYFGIYALLCLFLTGAITAHMLFEFSGDKFFITTAAFLSMIIPAVFIRSFMHEALAAQFLLFFTLETMFLFFKKKDLRSCLIRCALSGFLAGGTHIYFIPMCGMIVFSIFVFMIVDREKISRAFSVLFSYILSALFSVYIWGGFSTGLPAGSEKDFSGNSANLNTLFNPLSYSLFIKPLPMYDAGQDDGFSYPGLGVLVLFVVSVVSFVFVFRKGVRASKAAVISVVVLMLLSIFAATYNKVAFNDKLLLTYRIPLVNNLFGIFRGYGRMIWVLSSLLILLSFICLSFVQNKKFIVPILLCVLIAVQIADLSPLFTEKYTALKNAEEKTGFMETSVPLNDLLATGEYHHMLLDDSLKWTEDYSNFAVKNHLTLNRFYLARRNEEAEKKRQEEEIKNPTYDTIYVYKKKRSKVYEAAGIRPIDNNGKTLIGILCEDTDE